MAEAGVSKQTLIDLQIDNSLLTSDFESYKLSLEPVPIFEQTFDIGVSHVEPTSEQYSFQHVRLFGLHNHLYQDPWHANDVYYFNDQGKLLRNTWDSMKRSFETTEVWSDLNEGHEPGDYNYSLSLDCKDKAFILDGRKNGAISIINTGDRTQDNSIWSKNTIKVSSIPAAIILSSDWSSEGDNKYHCVLQSVVEASEIEELKVASQEQGHAFATLLQWITIGKGACTSTTEYEILSQRHICVHGSIDFAALEPGSNAIYVASQKEAFYAQDTTRPITPMLVRALKKPVHYLWDQTDEKITLKFTLPWTTHKEDVQVHHKHENGVFSVHVFTEGESYPIITGETSLTLADCEPSQCTVLDGRVELELKKGEVGVHWVEFIPGDTLGQPAPESELVRQANAALQHLTSDKEEQEGEMTQGFNCGQLEECDALPSDAATLVRLTADSHSPSHIVCLSAHQWICGTRLTPGLAPGLVLRHDVDALAWQPESPSGNTWKIKHTGTFPAFGYVQASKEQKKFIVCPPDLGFIAICESTHHVYLYHQPSPLSTELRNRKTGSKVAAVARQQVTRTPESVTQILGAVAANQILFILAKNSLLTMTLH